MVTCLLRSAMLSTYISITSLHSSGQESSSESLLCNQLATVFVYMYTVQYSVLIPELERLALVLIRRVLFVLVQIQIQRVPLQIVHTNIQVIFLVHRNTVPKYDMQSAKTLT